MKETFYFSHDYNARNDIKIKQLISKHGLLGYGIYWALIEELYNNANVLPLDSETLAYDLRVDEEQILSVIQDFCLFEYTDNTFSSNSVKSRLEHRNEKSNKAKQSAMKRWNKNATALQPQNEPNAIKESKGKESKGKESKSINTDLNELNSLNDVFVHKSTKDSLKPLKTAKKAELLAYPYTSNQFIEIWNVLIKEKKWIKKSDAALQASLNKLAGYGEQGAIESMNDAIAGGYQGVFEPKSMQKQNQSKLIKNKNAFEEAKLKLKNDVDNASL